MGMMWIMEGMTAAQLDSWRVWVAAVSGGDSVREIGRRIGRSGMTTVSQLSLRDRKGGGPPGRPHAEAVVDFARAYGVDPKQALVMSRHLTEAEAARNFKNNKGYQDASILWIGEEIHRLCHEIVRRGRNGQGVGKWDPKPTSRSVDRFLGLE